MDTAIRALTRKYKLPLSVVVDLVRVGRALRPMRRARSYVASFIIDEDDGYERVDNAIHMLLLKCSSDDAYGKIEVRVNKITKDVEKQNWSDLTYGEKVTFHIGEREKLSKAMLKMSDFVVEIAKPVARDYQIAIYQMHSIMISAEEADELYRWSDIIDVSALFAAGRPVSRAMTMLRELNRRPKAKPHKGPKPVARINEDGVFEFLEESVRETQPCHDYTTGPRLEQLSGYGEAQDWGLDLAKDLQEFRAGRLPWQQISKGLLLSGPPGCGKTTYAQALARTCDVPLITGSYGEWAAGIGQSDLLKKMRRTFEAAAKAAPVILFIDEVDSFMDRDSMPDYLAAWERQVVNGLLELVDGVASAEGIVVIGACNNPGVVDKALKRAGRLDHHIAIPLPDDRARYDILRHHLRRGGVPHPGSLSDVVERTAGESGAALEKIVRDAIRRARRLNRPVTIGDLLESLPPRIQLSQEYMYRAAVHELGHAIVGVETSDLKLEFCVIADSYDPSARETGAAGGGVKFEDTFAKVRTKDHFLSQIATMLAAGAAEELVFGDIGDGRISDLMQATNYATALEVTWGYGENLMSEGDLDRTTLQTMRWRDRDLQERIEQTLREQMERAKAILADHRDILLDLAIRLLNDKRLEPSAIYEALEWSKKRLKEAC